MPPSAKIFSYCQFFSAPITDLNALVDKYDARFWMAPIKQRKITVRITTLNHKLLFDAVNKLLSRHDAKPGYPCPDSICLANSFAYFFVSKADKIHHDLLNRRAGLHLLPTWSSTKTCSSVFQTFSPVSEPEVLPFVRGPREKSRDLDPLLACVLQNCLHVLLPVITKIVYLSLETGCVFPVSLKVAMLSPPLEKRLLIVNISPTFGRSLT